MSISDMSDWLTLGTTTLVDWASHWRRSIHNTQQPDEASIAQYIDQHM